MIFKDKTDFISPPFKVEANEVFVTVASKGFVDIEVLEQDSHWRAFPETSLVGPLAKLIPVPADTPLRVYSYGANTVTAYQAVAVMEEPVVVPESQPVEPETPVEEVTPVEPETPVVPETPVEPEPETPVEPEAPVVVEVPEPVPEPVPEVQPVTPVVPEQPVVTPVPTPAPVEYDYITTSLNDYDSEYWANGVWIYSARAGINIPATAANVAAFVAKAVVNFNGNGSQKAITEVQVVGANISVWFEGSALPAAVGYPATVSVKVVKQAVVTTPESTPAVSAPAVAAPVMTTCATGPSFGMNFASGTFSDHDTAKLPGVFDKDYTYPTAATFARWKARGVKHVRFPIRWERIQPTMMAALDTTEAQRLLAVYGHAAANGMVIVLDLHNYMQRCVNGVKYDIGTTQVPQTAYNDVWVRLVGLVGSHSASYGYGIMNEPMGTQGRWAGIAQSVVNAIRTVDATTYIFVNGDAWATPLNWATANPGFPLQGENLVYEAHLYFDKNAGGGYADAAEQIDPQVGVNRLTPYINWLKKYGQKGVVGEVGWPANRATAVAAAKNALLLAAANDVRVFGWMAGDWLDSGNVLSIELNGVAQAQVDVFKQCNKEITTHGPHA
jgi:aryl-phospho-beta-D-glucosidase BglC (GH1 family)